MKLFSAKQLKDADERTLQTQNISSTELMERAANLVFEKLHQALNLSQVPIKIFCGIGNNGGDGLAIGRLLLEQGYNVSTYIVNYSDKRSKDFLINYDRIKDVSTDWPQVLTSESELPALNENDIVIDAIFGIGLNRPLPVWVAKLIQDLNASRSFVVSVDVPSGMRIDEPSEGDNSIIRANHTYTFQAPKLAFFLPASGSYPGNIEVLDIELDKKYLESVSPVAEIIDRNKAQSLYRERDKFAHKGNFGHALLIGGSYGKMGSICLTTTACMRSGAGMATVFAPQCGHDIVQTSIPEAMLLTDPSVKHISSITFNFDPAVVCFGVGVGQHEDTLKAFEELLDKVERPMLIDADGLNLLATNPGLLEKLPKNSVLTPHPKELERLIGKWTNDYDKIEKAKAFVAEYQLVLVIKGAFSMLISGEQLFINTTGNPGMATAGSGDVLSGVISGLLSQGYDPLSAALLGVYLHGKAGDIAAQQLSPEALLAGDIAGFLGAAYLDLHQETAPNSN